MAKTTIQTNLLGRTARPSPLTLHCWPWAWRFEADKTKAVDPLKVSIDGRFYLTLLEERAEITAVYTDSEGSVKVSLENTDGEIGDAYAQTIALVPKEKKS